MNYTVIITEKWDNFERVTSPLLKNLDPSLFQNIILGILAIFIPFAIVFYTNILDSKKKRSEFEKMVLSDEVLGTKGIFWFSIFTILVFSFFAGKAVSFNAKILTIFYLIIAVFILWKPFKKILIFSEGRKTEFEIAFLKKLRLSKILPVANNAKSEKMIRAWSSFWSEESGFNERDFTSIFISHIDDNISQGKLNNAIQLARTYNLKCRETFLIGYEILPKIFEWNEKLWEREQLWLKTYDWEKKIKEIFPEKYLPTFQKLALRLFKRAYRLDDSFWNWNYFEQEFFKEIIAKLLDGNHYELFSHFKKHIDSCENKLKIITIEEEKQRYWYYVTGIFKVFCTSLFDNINKTQSNYTIWEHDFPNEWKITESNFQNNPSRIIFNEFLSWSQDKIFKKDNGSEYNDDLTEVINGLFPNVHPAYFPDFLMFFFSHSIKNALDKQPNFFVMGSSLSWSGEKSDDEISEMFKQNELSRQEETINIILKYFSDWKYIKIFREDLIGDENLKWNEFSGEEKEKIIKRIRINKFNNLKEELNSEEIKKYCEASEIKDKTRKEFLGLISLLIDKISK